MKNAWRLGLAILVLGGVFTGGKLLGQPSEDRLGLAEKEIANQSYKRALDILDKAVEAETGPRLQKACLLRAIAMCNLRDKKGHVYAQEIMDTYLGLKKNGELWHAMGQSWQFMGDPKKSYQSYVTAAELFTKSDQPAKAFASYRSAIERLRRNFNQIFHVPDTQYNWTLHRQKAMEKAMEFGRLCEKLKISDKDKALVVFEAGSFAAEAGSWEHAEKGIEYLKTISEKYKRTPHAPAGLLVCGRSYERFNKFHDALKMYAQISVYYPLSPEAGDAAKRVTRIRAPQVNIHIPTAVKPGQKAEIHWNIRNLRKVHFSVKRVLLKDLQNLTHLDRGDKWYEKVPQESEPIATWGFDTPDDGNYLHYNSQQKTDKKPKTTVTCPVDEEGLYVITAQGRNPSGKKASATCLLSVSNISCVSKNDGGKLVVYTADVHEGSPVSNASVALFKRSDSKSSILKKYLFKDSDDAGLVELDLTLKGNQRYYYDSRLIVIKGKSAAIIERLNISYRRRHRDKMNREMAAYGFAERPVYRPEHTVRFKEIIRFKKDGTYVNAPDEKIDLKIHDPKGEVVYQHEFVTDKFGAFEGSFKLSKKAKLGEYRIELRHDNNRNFRFRHAQGNRFRVEEYRKPEFEVTVSTDKSDYRVGDEVKVEILAKYLFGQPVVKAEIKYDIRKQSFRYSNPWPVPYPWYRESYFGRDYGYWGGYYRRLDEHVKSGKVTTDENGKAYVMVKAEAFKGHEAQDLKFLVNVTATDSSRRVIRGGGQVIVTHAPFAIFAKPAWSVYSPGDQVKVEVTTKDPNGKPVSGNFTTEAWTLKHVEDKDGKKTLQPDKKIYSGKLQTSVSGRADVRFVPDVSGRIRVVIKEDKADKPVTGQCEFWVAAKNERFEHYSYGDLELIVSKDQLEIGDTLKILLNTKHDGYVLLTQEAEDILNYRLVKVAAGTNSLELKIDKKHCPNFELQAVMIKDAQIIRDAAKIIVPPTNRFIDVKVTLEKGDKNGGADNTYQPREKFNIKVKLTDKYTGKPVRGQMTLMMVDSAVYYIQPEYRQAIEKAMYGSIRHNRVNTQDNFYHRQRHWYSRKKGGMKGRGSDVYVVDGAAYYESGDFMAARALPSIAPRSEMKEAEAELVKPVVRKEFRDTVLWAGAVETGEDGTATLPVTLPDQLGRFALHAIAFDADTRVGQTRQDVISSKRIIARLQTPRFFTEGDSSYVTVIAHNYYDKPYKAIVDIEYSRHAKVRGVFVDGKWTKFDDKTKPIEIDIPAGGEVRLDYDADITEPGHVKLLASVKTSVESDAIELKKQVLAWGMMRLDPFGGELSDKGARQVIWNIDVPDKIRPDSQSFTVMVNPSLMSVVFDALPYLAEYPYGCVEQTTSRFVPLVQVRKTLQDAGIKLSDIRKKIETSAQSDPKLKAYYKLLESKMRRNPVWDDDEIDKMIEKGIDRLTKLQRPDGSWGWWKHGDVDGYMTAYVVSSLVIARQCDVKLPDGMLDRGADWLVKMAGTPKRIEADTPWWRRRISDDNTRAYMLYAIGRADSRKLDDAKIRKEIERIYTERSGLSDYGRALLAMVMYDAGMKEKAKIIVANLDNTAVVDEKRGTVHWGQQIGWWYWYRGAEETTAWVLQAMMKVDPENNNMPDAALWLVTNRRQMRWGNTKTTAMVSNALISYATKMGQFDCDQTYEVLLDGVCVKKVRVTKDNLFTFDNKVVIPAEQLSGGKHTVTVKQQGAGTLYCDGYLQYFDKADRIGESANRVGVSRKYYKLTKEEFTNTRTVWKDGKRVEEEFPDTRYKRAELAFGREIKTGELIEVQLDITADENLEYMIFEDPKPAGCEPYRLTSGGQYGGFYSHMEVRDTKTVFFADWVQTGSYTVKYKLVCEQPGTFRIIPTNGEAMYTPYVKANSQSGLMTITR